MSHGQRTLSVVTWFSLAAVAGMLYLGSAAFAADQVQRFTLLCKYETFVLAKGGARKSPISLEETISFEIAGKTGRYYSFESETWQPLYDVTGEELYLRRVNDVWTWAPESAIYISINRQNGNYFSLFRGVNDHRVEKSEGQCEKIAYRPPPAKKF